MKRFRKNILGVLAGLFIVLIGIVLFNATDEALSPEAARALEPMEAQPGFPISNLQFKREAGPEKIQFSTFQEYLDDPIKFNAALARNQKFLEPFLEGIEVGTVAVEPKITFREGVSTIFPFVVHRYFLISLSQKIHQGKAEGALVLLEKSNHLLLSIISTPQFLINTMIAVAALKDNAFFVAGLKEQDVLKKQGLLKRFPPSLKQSFKPTSSAEEILQQAIRRERQAGTDFILNSEDLVSDFGLAEKEPKGFIHQMKSFILKAFYRPQQSANWFAKMNKETDSSECPSQDVAVCSRTYKEEVLERQLLHLIINPVGRSLLKMYRVISHGDHLAKVKNHFSQIDLIAESL